MFTMPPRIFTPNANQAEIDLICITYTVTSLDANLREHTELLERVFQALENYYDEISQMVSACEENTKTLKENVATFEENIKVKENVMTFEEIKYIYIYIYILKENLTTLEENIYITKLAITEADSKLQWLRYRYSLINSGGRNAGLV